MALIELIGGYSGILLLCLNHGNSLDIQYFGSLLTLSTFGLHFNHL